jgi:hypothetical protein
LQAQRIEAEIAAVIVVVVVKSAPSKLLETGQHQTNGRFLKVLKTPKPDYFSIKTSFIITKFYILSGVCFLCFVRFSELKAMKPVSLYNSNILLFVNEI